jgi:membrane associated rhomboid family serine protease
MVLIGINVAVFVLVALWTRDGGVLGGSATDAHLELGLSRAVLEQPILWEGADGTVFLTEPDGWYRLVTSGFLHFGIVHLGLNMYFLYVLGPQLEQALGRWKFLALYMASLLGGSLGVILLDSGGISAGASGAVFGLLGAAAAGMWRQGVNPLTTGIGTLLLLNLFITFAFPGISIGGHVGGAVTGAICGAIMLAPRGQVPEWTRWATPLIAMVVAVGASVAIVSG